MKLIAMILTDDDEPVLTTKLIAGGERWVNYHGNKPSDVPVHLLMELAIELTEPNGIITEA